MEEKIREHFERLREIHLQGKCVESVNFEEEILAEPYGWGFRRTEINDFSFFTMPEIPINMNVIMLEFMYTMQRLYGYKVVINFIGIDYSNISQPAQDYRLLRVYRKDLPIHRQSIPTNIQIRELPEISSPNPIKTLLDLGYPLYLVTDQDTYVTQKSLGISEDQNIFLVTNNKGEERVAKLTLAKRLFSSENSHEEYPTIEARAETVVDGKVIVLPYRVKIMEKLLLLSHVKVPKLYLDILSFLTSFHAQGFAHFDIKPDNIMYSPSLQKYVLIDFEDSQRVNGEDERGIFTPYYSSLNRAFTDTIEYFNDAFQVSDLWEFGKSLQTISPGIDLSSYYSILKDEPLRPLIDLQIYRRLSSLPFEEISN